MSAVTIYVLVKDGKVTDVSRSLNPQLAIEDFKWSAPGEIYACQMSESAAGQVWDAFTNYKKGSIKATAPISLVKLYSNSMMKCADVT